MSTLCAEAVISMKCSTGDDQTEAVNPRAMAAVDTDGLISARWNQSVSRDCQYFLMHVVMMCLSYPLPPVGFPKSSLLRPMLVMI